jgi:hypothetical protein
LTGGYSRVTLICGNSRPLVWMRFPHGRAYAAISGQGLPALAKGGWREEVMAGSEWYAGPLTPKECSDEWN